MRNRTGWVRWALATAGFAALCFGGASMASAAHAPTDPVYKWPASCAAGCSQDLFFSYDPGTRQIHDLHGLSAGSGRCTNGTMTNVYNGVSFEIHGDIPVNADGSFSFHGISDANAYEPNKTPGNVDIQGALARDGTATGTFHAAAKYLTDYGALCPVDGVTTTFNATGPPPTPTADLSVTSSCPSTVPAGRPYNCTATVANAGPGAASAAHLDVPVPVREVLVDSLPSQGTCEDGANVSCALGPLGPGAQAQVTYTLIPRYAGAGDAPRAARSGIGHMELTALTGTQLATLAHVSDPTIEDPVPANNTASDTVAARTRVGVAAVPGRSGIGAHSLYRQYGYFSDDNVNYYRLRDYGCSRKDGQDGYGYIYGRGDAQTIAKAGSSRYQRIKFRLQIYADSLYGAISGTPFSFRGNT